MGYALDPAAPLAAELRRVVTECLDDAGAQLAGETGNDLDTRVHEARKRVKEARAVLRLVRDGSIDATLVRGWGDRLRDASRLLAPLRDAEVLRRTMARLEVGDDEALVAARERAVEALAAQARSERARAAQAQLVAEMAGRLAEVRDELDGWDLVEDRWRALDPGLRRVYRQGRRRLRAALDEPSDEALHEWRKRAKDLWYLHLLLGPAWPQVLEPVATQAHELSDLLGDHQDLAVLADRLGDAALGLDAGERTGLEQVIRARQAALRRDAFALGERLYAEKPAAFAARLGRVWKAARRTAEPVPAPESAQAGEGEPAPGANASEVSA